MAKPQNVLVFAVTIGESYNVGSDVVWGRGTGDKFLMNAENETHKGKKNEAEAVKIAGQMVDAVTGIKPDEQALEEEKVKGLAALAAGIGHDFNNLLMVIMGNAEFALMDLPPRSPVRESIIGIRAAARRAADLCKHLLAYSGKGHVGVEPLDLSEIVRRMEHLLSVPISKKVSFGFDLARDLPPIEGDAAQIRQVIMSLVVHVSDATSGDDSAVSIKTGTRDCSEGYFYGGHLGEKLPAGRYVFLEVSVAGGDTGERRDRRVIDPLFAEKPKGGRPKLAAVLGIIRYHRAALKIDPADNRGTTLTVFFPISLKQIPKVETEEPRGPWRTTGTILLVDDEETVRTVAGRMLKHLGFTVLTAAGGNEAVDIFRKHCDETVVVLLDMTMPGLSSQEVFKELKRDKSDVRIVLTSGFEEADATRRFGLEGLAGFIQKPYELKALRQKLREIVSG